ncbi:hypothetical protein H6M51_20735 [Rhizobium sp. AQ_MP]|uniref:hypothetical protein n=1 Tax=Rhizobium sp. AQ_MP TaxID=2761536 RepID=UPI0016399C06|nr:hypothetical protein [Rhizobium sp. AQ_MP]MBC2775292.1 hypothetical protein [Rhizobium sp. AQ_MP]
MAYIEVFPKSVDAESRIKNDSDALMGFLFEITRNVFQVPDHDIIVELNRCTTLGFNKMAVRTGSVPDVVIKISTSDTDLQTRFQDLTIRIVEAWNSHFGDALKMELWIGLIHTWGCNIQFEDA